MLIIKTLTAITVAFALLSHPAISLASQYGRQAGSEVANTSAEELTVLETENLTFMREEEKLARDVYLTMYEAWDLNIFTNIAASEQSHTDAVAEMLEKYKLPDPVVDDRVGIFVNQELAHCFTYNDLDSLERVFQAHPDEVAVVIMEPLTILEPKQNFLEDVKAMTHHYGALLMFDEVMTCFRFAFGGAQELMSSPTIF